LFGINTGGQVEVRAGTGVNALSLSDGSDIVTLFSTGLYPATYPINLGSTANPWGPNFYMAGFLSGTNYSRLSISHSGTNGAVVFDSQANGTAGISRPFVFTNANAVFQQTPTVTGIPFSIARNPNTINATCPYYITNVFMTNLTAGTNLIFTSPSGMRSIVIMGRILTTNAVSFYPMLRSSGVDYLTGTSATTSTVTGNTVSDGIVREPGEGFCAYVNGNANAYATIFVFTNTIPWYTARLLDVNSGNNTLYTCPTNTVCQSVAFHNGTMGPNPKVSNRSGGARAYSAYLVPSGLTTADVFPVGVQAATSDNTTYSVGSIQDCSLMEGDSVVVTSDSSTDTQCAWMTVFETPE
jgi:hypothetical protein